VTQFYFGHSRVLLHSLVLHASSSAENEAPRDPDEHHFLECATAQVRMEG
jgi:hypothetical protein